VLAALASFGATGTTLAATFDRDHAPFMVAGVPAMTLWVEEGSYDAHHHTVTDTFDKVDPRLLATDTAAMAILAWELADAPEPIGKRLGRQEAETLLKKSGVEATRRMVYGSSPR
jgi:Zn-dependent M28 family amino/carboxypeptidase